MAYTGNPYEVIPELESLGVERVRELLSTREFGDFGSMTRSITEEWLSRKDASIRADQALSTARLANKIAIAASILSAIAIIIQIMEWYSK
jgi:hypothetical protein